MKSFAQRTFKIKNTLLKKLPLLIPVVVLLLFASTYVVYSYFFRETSPVQQEASPLPTTGPVPVTPSPSPSPSASPSLRPTSTASPKPVSAKLFIINSPSTWDTNKSTGYFFSAHANVPLKTITIKFGESEYELTPDSAGNFFRGIDIKVGKTVITATAVAVSGKTEVQTFTVTKTDSLSQIDPKLTGVQCDGAKLDECRNYSGYTEGKCVKYTLYVECLRTKCDVNTLPKDQSCKSQTQ